MADKPTTDDDGGCCGGCCSCNSDANPYIRMQQGCEGLRNRFFYGFAKTVVRYHYWAIGLCVLLTCAASGGWAFWGLEYRVDKLYVPQDSRAFQELDEYALMFGDLATRTQHLIITEPERRTDGSTTGQYNNVLTQSTLLYLLDLHNKIINVKATVTEGGVETQLGWSDVCYKPDGPLNCHGLSILEAFDYDRTIIEGLTTDQQIVDHINANPNRLLVNGRRVSGQFIGLVGNPTLTTDANGLNVISNGTALTMTYLGKSRTEVDKTRSEAWEAELITVLEAEQDLIANVVTGPNMVYQSERSLDDDSYAATGQDIILITLTFSIMCTFACTALCTNWKSFDCKDFCKGHYMIALGGMGSVWMSIATAIGLGLLFQVPFVPICGVMPFVLLGIGIDDTFLMTKEFDLFDDRCDPKERVTIAVTRVATTVALTSLTDLMAFCMGLITDFPAVYSFCAYMSLGVAIDWIYQMTFFVGFMVFEAQRIRHIDKHNPWLIEKCCPKCCPCCLKDNNPEIVEDGDIEMADADGKGPSSPQSPNEDEPLGDQPPQRSNTYVPAIPRTVEHRPNKITRFMSWLVINWVSKIIVLVLYFTALGFSIWGTLNLKQGLDLRLLSLPTSQLPSYFDALDEHLQVGLEMRFLVYDRSLLDRANAGENIDFETAYGSDEFLAKFNTSMDGLVATEYVFADQGVVNYAYPFSAVKAAVPNTTLSQYMSAGGESSVVDMGFTNLANQDLDRAGRLALVESKAGPKGVKAGVLLNLLSSSGREASIAQKEAMLGVRRYIDEEVTGGNYLSLVACPYFRYFEQYVVIFDSTIRNMLLAVAAVFIATLLLTGSLALSVITTLAVVSVDVMLFGLMAAWDIALDSVSSVNLVIAIGLAADYVIHTTHDILSPADPEVKRLPADERVRASLEHVGVAVLLGGVSTFLGVMPTAFASSHVFRLFFKMFVGIVGFALLHGLVIIPVILSLVLRMVPNDAKLLPVTGDDAMGVERVVTDGDLQQRDVAANVDGGWNSTEPPAVVRVGSRTSGSQNPLG